jgi:hypothetical protein
VHQYLAVFGDGAARAIAKTMTRFDSGAIRKAMDGIAAIGCYELILSPCTAQLAEVERASSLIG